MPKTLILLALVGGVLASAPAGAQTQQNKPSPPATSPPPAEVDPRLNDVEMRFINAEGAIWVNRSVNDTVYWPGYSPNAVYTERDAARAEGQVRKIASGNKVSDLTVTPSRKTEDYQININGKVVPVQAQP
ncbi:hypothetical protein DYH09_31210 [bacterium CPR1]|nr:hypothetical protein [bacterium CPR1]